jgi:hypothetical protein
MIMQKQLIEHFSGKEELIRLTIGWDINEKMTAADFKPLIISDIQNYQAPLALEINLLWCFMVLLLTCRVLLIFKKDRYSLMAQ